MTQVPRRTLPVRPTSSESAMQARALELDGKPAEVLVKAARDLIVAAAIYKVTGTQRPRLDLAAARYTQHAIANGAANLSADPVELSGHAATVLCRYLS